MDKYVYASAQAVLMGVFVGFPLIIMPCVIVKHPNTTKYIATSAFDKVFHYTVEDNKKKLYFLELRITDRKLAKSLSSKLSLVLLSLVSLALNVFIYFLIFDISNECQEGFDCYKYLSHDRHPVSCEVARNESMQVVCYRFTFNLFLATGVGYGVFKVGMLAVYVWSMSMFWLHRKYPNNADPNYLYLKYFGTFLLLVVLTIVLLIIPFYTVAVTPVDTIKFAFNYGAIVLCCMGISMAVPWWQLAELKEPVEDFSVDESGSQTEALAQHMT